MNLTKEDLSGRMQSTRQRIRREHHQRMLSEHRKEILNHRYPLRSKTLELLATRPLEELPLLSDAINQQLRNQQTQELSDEEQRDLVDDLRFLLGEVGFRLDFPIRFRRNGDSYVSEFVCEYFDRLCPAQVIVWLQHMNLEQRRELYVGLDCRLHCEYMSNTLLRCLVEDFDQEEAAELMCEFVDRGVQVQRLVSMQLIKKLQACLESPSRSFAYVHLAVGIYLRFSNEGFSEALLQVVFSKLDEATSGEQLGSYITAINLIQETMPAASLKAPVRQAIQAIESLLPLLETVAQNRHVLKLLILCVENHRQHGQEYFLRPITIALLQRQPPNPDTMQLFTRLCSRIQLPHSG